MKGGEWEGTGLRRRGLPDAGAALAGPPGKALHQPTPTHLLLNTGGRGARPQAVCGQGVQASPPGVHRRTARHIQLALQVRRRVRVCLCM